MNKIILATLFVFALPLGAHALVVDTGASLDADAAATVEEQLRVDGDASAQILMQTDAEENQAQAISSFEVETEADLAAYSATAEAGYAHVTRVDASGEEEIVVEYAHPALLFGLFPITVTSETRVLANADGSAGVKTTLPWWSFFTVGLAKAAADVESALSGSAAVQNFASAAAGADASASVRAQATEAIITALNASAGASLVME